MDTKFITTIQYLDGTEESFEHFGILNTKNGFSFKTDPLGDFFWVNASIIKKLVDRTVK